MTSDALQTVILAAIAAIVTIAAPVIAFMLASVANNQKKVSAEVADVHHIVNNSQTEMVKRLAEMNERLLAMAATNAELVETARGKELQAARAEQPPRTGERRAGDQAGPVDVKIVQSDDEPVIVRDASEVPPDRLPRAGRPPPYRPPPENDPTSHLGTG